MAASDEAPNTPTDDEMLQAQAELWRHTLSYLTSMTLRCAIHLGIPTAIHRRGGSASLPNLIEALSLPPAKLPFLRRLMRLLVHSGIFSFGNEDDDDAAGETTYHLTLVPLFLVDDDTSAVVVDGHLPQLMLHHWSDEDCVKILAQCKKAIPLREERGKVIIIDIVIGFDSGPMLESQLLIGRERVKVQITAWRRGPSPRPSCTSKCTMLDIPRVVGDVPADGVVEYVAGDMFDFIPPSQAAMLNLMLHHWSDEDCVKILAQCNKAIPLREERERPMLESHLLTDVAVMLVTKGRQRDENDWRDLFMKPGFSDYKVVKKLGPRCVIEVYP
uniref:O-methyltransferase domain-containing protein n=1 Tax=Oryza punctata TaxID=4537 RepID=A0A0E0MEV7_ORYPU